VSPSVPYSVTIAPSARRALQRLPEKVASACVEFILGPLADNPHRLGKPLNGPLAAYHAARRGAYRVVYSIDDADHSLTVVRIDHRADVYR